MNQDNYVKQVFAKNFTVEHLDTILALKNLPIEIHKMIVETKENVQSYDLTQLKPPLQKLTGELLSSTEVLNIINDVSEYGDWKLVKSKETFDDSDLNSIGFGVHPTFYALAINESKFYEFSRKQYKHGDINRIVVQCLLGHLDVSFDTGSVGYSLEKIITNSQFKKQLKAHI